MTENNAAAPANLPDGYDDDASFWFVHPDLRAGYVSTTDAEIAADPSLPALRAELSKQLCDEAREALRESMLAEYTSRYGVNREQALRYIGDMSGRVALSREDHQAIDRRFTVGTGSGWPLDAEQRVAHLRRRVLAIAVVQRAKSAAAQEEQNRCIMCLRANPANRPTMTYPLKGQVTDAIGTARGPGLLACAGCADVIRVEAAQLRAQMRVEGLDEVTIRDRAREYVAAHLPLLVPDEVHDAAAGGLAALLAQARR